MRTFSVALLVFILAVFHVFALGKAAEERKLLPSREDASYVLPSALLKITALEYDGLVSDFLFLKGLVFRGSTHERTERPRVKEWEWKWLFQVFTASTDLDPYFYDPYYMVNSYFTWEAGMVRETNALLEKGAQRRYWDWSLPFYLGFNHFYFLQENDKASEYLMEASRRPGAGSNITKLALRMAYKGNRIVNAIMFLEEILRNTEDETLRKEYEIRLEAFQNILVLEKAVSAYKAKFGKAPAKATDMVRRGIIEKLPQDPYGGNYYIDAQGMVKTTSDFIMRARR